MRVIGKPVPSGLTLLELVIVLAILVAMAGIVVPMVSKTISSPSFKTPSGEKSAQQIATEATMARIKEAIMGSGDNPGCYGDMGELPWPPRALREQHPQLRYLFVNPATEDTTQDFDPNTRRGWRGPYVLSPTGKYIVFGTFTRSYGETGDPALVDAWATPIVIILKTELGQTNAYLVSAGNDATLGTSDDITLILREDV